MPIRVVCPQCSAALSVRDDKAGKKGKCPQCASELTVPAVSQAASDTSDRKAKVERKSDTSANVESKTVTSDAPLVAKVGKGGIAKSSAASGKPPKMTKRKKRVVPEVAAPAPPPEDFGNVPLDKLIRGEIKRVRKSPFYFFALLMVTLCMIVLPVIYVASIAGVGIGVYLHAIHNLGMLEYGRGRGKVAVALIYAAPLVIGSILILFMIKPLLARPSKRILQRSLDRKFQPVLFRFVDEICEIVGSPKPKRIDVNYLVNASASFRKGMFSFVGSDLVLTIGIPMVAGMTLRQFAGVMAHEFGHFAQGAGMRMSYISSSINAWFERIVYERDEWDEWLAESASETDLRIGWILYLSMFCVWLSRMLLWILMTIGHALSCYLSRQMEYDADRYEARLAGSAQFEATTHRFQELSVGFHPTMNFVFSHLQGDVFPDDISKILLRIVDSIPPKELKKLRKKLAEQKTGLFHTHPSDTDRIANTSKENTPGIFIADGPASQIFHDFDALSRGVTYYFYSALGAKFTPNEMTPVAELFKEPTLPSEMSSEEPTPKMKLAT